MKKLSDAIEAGIPLARLTLGNLFFIDEFDDHGMVATTPELCACTLGMAILGSGELTLDQARRKAEGVGWRELVGTSFPNFVERLFPGSNRLNPELHAAAHARFGLALGENHTPPFDALGVVTHLTDELNVEPADIAALLREHGW